MCDASNTPSYRFGTQRAVAPAQTLRRIAPLLSKAGITRLADVTGLDWIGLPVYQAIRPNSRNISVSQGKGLTRAQARVSALMESLESFHAEEIAQPGVHATVGSMRRQLAYDPYALPVLAAPPLALPRNLEEDPYAPPLGQPSLLKDDTPVEWIEATDLSTGQQTWVPRQLCELDFTVQERLCVPLFRATSNGLSSGNTVAEALVHGLCEVIERDALWHMRRQPERVVDVTSIEPVLARQVLSRFNQVGMRVRIVDITGPIGVPTFAAFLSHPESPGQYYGAGCHPRRSTALLRALTEAAQSRLGHIAGSRDDLFRRSYAPRGGAESELSGGCTLVRFEDVSDLPRQPWTDMVRELVGRIRLHTGMAPLAVDLARVEFGLPVVMVIAPGLRIVVPRRA